MNRLCLSLGDKLLLLAFFLAYFSGLLKLLGGSTILLLTDFLLLLVLFLKSPIIYQKINGIRACVLSLGILLLVSIAIFEVFNPNVRDFVYALKGLRVNVFIFIYFFVGLSIGRKTTYVIYFFKMLSFLVGINILFAIMEFLFPYNPLFYHLIKWEFGDELDAIYTVRVCGLLVGSVQLALSCGFLFVYSLINFLFGHFDKKKLVLGLLGFIGLLISKSRAVLFSSLFLVFLLLLLNRHIKTKVKINIVLLFFVFLLGIILLLFLFFDNDVISILISRYFDAFNPDSLAGSSFKVGRINRWLEDVLPAIKSLPFGGGSGFTQSFGEDANLAYYTEPILTESIYFDVFIELGWGAGILFLFLIVYIAFLAIRSIRISSDNINLTCALCVLLFLIPGITSPNMAAFPYTYFFSLSLGILVVRMSVYKPNNYRTVSYRKL